MSYTLANGRIEPSSSAETYQCAVCSSDLTSLGEAKRQQHYDNHFNDPPQPAPNSGSNTSSPNKRGLPTLLSPRRPGKNDDRFWFPAQAPALQPPYNFQPGLIPLLRKHLLASASAAGGGGGRTKSATTRAVVCCERAVLVNQTGWDRMWGCGYRNYLMACAALMDQQTQPMYFPLLDDPYPPSVENLQRVIEDAWSAGYDPEGKRQLKRLVGTHTKIGVGDIQVAFTYRGIPSLLVEFDLKHKGGGADVLINWTIEYFSHSHGVVDNEKARVDKENAQVRPMTINDALRGASAVTTTARMPFILQHNGHSRTIVGYEVTKGGEVNLLQFDPAGIPDRSIREAGRAMFATMSSRSSAASSPSSSSKRPATASMFGDSPPLKRSRTDDRDVIDLAAEEEDDDDVVILPSPNNKNKTKAPQVPEKLNTSDVLKCFRLQPSKIIKQNKYQVLYFPMAAPLTDSEKQSQSKNGYGEKIS
ncbi:hypothetical protein MKEN_01062900 [Mycena kentingensis (nom. inval.)]|nr:hypothetical protein MKEN_01062900 [Mycena kentingensis (nom. inval.)]